jgi:DNA-binding NarL/FixJ family response regulator
MREHGARADEVATSDEFELFAPRRWLELASALELTPRQIQVAQSICSGCTYKQIALRSGISINTVRMHVRGLYQRLGTCDRVGVILRIISTERRLPSVRSAE